MVGIFPTGGTTGPSKGANVTNLGNVNINISVKGYARNLSDGLAMVCEVGNISIGNEKYSSIPSMTPTDFRNLTIANSLISNMTVRQQTNASENSLNSTYWILYVPPNPFGQCNGTVVFQAEFG